MHPDEIKAGEWYVAKAGNWIFDVEEVGEDRIARYTVLQTGQKCQTHVVTLAGRCARLAGTPGAET